MSLNYSNLTIILIFLQGIINPIIINNILTQINILEKIEVKISDKITTLNKSKNIPNNIVLVNLDNEYKQKKTTAINFKERIFYPSLVKSLLEAQAAVVVLNFPSHWREIPDDDWIEVDQLNSELKDLISTYPERLILVNPIDSLASLEEQKKRIYNHLLPKNDQDEFIIESTDVQGFFEWNIHAQNINNLSNPARVINLQDNTILEDKNIFSEDFKSLGILATDKYYQYFNQKKSTNLSQEYPHRFYVKYLGQSGIFNHLNIENVCQINNLINYHNQNVIQRLI